MSSTFPIHKVPDIGEFLAWMAKRRKISVTALVGAGGAKNSSLTGFATGSKRTQDLNMIPVFRVVKAAGFEFVARPRGGAIGIRMEVPGGLPLRVVGVDGGTLEIPVISLPDVAIMLNTIAAANGLAITAMMKKFGSGSTSLVSLATGRAPDKDIRFNNVLQVLEVGGFELLGRPAHASARAARMAFAAVNVGTGQ